MVWQGVRLLFSICALLGGIMRTQSITFFCAILFVIGFSQAIRSIGQFFLAPGLYSFFMLIISFIGLYCYYGLWNMKRWCIPLFFAVWGCLLLILLLGGGQFTTIIYLRLLYLVVVIIAFIAVVLPHRGKLSGAWLWPLKK